MFSSTVTAKDEGREFEACPNCRSTMYYEYRPPTKKELRQYLYLKKEIESLGAQLEKLSPSAAEYPELYETYENGKLRCLALLIKTEKFIYDIDDSLLRQVFRLKYIKGLTWEQVSAQMGGYVKSDCLRIMHDRYLRSLNK